MRRKRSVRHVYECTSARASMGVFECAGGHEAGTDRWLLLYDVEGCSTVFSDKRFAVPHGGVTPRTPRDSSSRRSQLHKQTRELLLSASTSAHTGGREVAVADRRSAGILDSLIRHQDTAIVHPQAGLGYPYVEGCRRMAAPKEAARQRPSAPVPATTVHSHGVRCTAARKPLQKATPSPLHCLRGTCPLLSSGLPQRPTPIPHLAAAVAS
jgi:hypothetical protein